MMALQQSKQKKDAYFADNQEKEQRINLMRNQMGLKKDFGKSKNM